MQLDGECMIDQSPDIWVNDVTTVVLSVKCLNDSLKLFPVSENILRERSALYFLFIYFFMNIYLNIDLQRWIPLL